MVQLLFTADRFQPFGRPIPGVPMLLDADMRLIEPACAWLLHITLVRGRTRSVQTWRTYAEVLYDWWQTLDANGWAWDRAGLHEVAAYRDGMLSRKSQHTGRSYARSTINVWERFMREVEHAAPSTIRRRLAALSSLYKHLVRHGYAAKNPVTEVDRPAINRDEGSTLAFSKAQARKLLDAPAEDSVAGRRDRAILSVGLQVGLRRAEIAALAVGDLHQNRGYDSLRVTRKGGRRDALAINPQTATRLRAYLEAAGHAADMDGPLFRPLAHNGKRQEARRRMDPDAVDRVVRKYALGLGLDRGYSAHSMRATFITTALDNGAQLEDVQKAAGHRDPSTTKLYDRRGYNPEKAASFFVRA